MNRKLAYRLGALLSALVVIGVLGWRLLWVANGHDAAGEAVEDVHAFLDEHWERPLAPQGMPPDHYPPNEASLGVHACAQCHARQFEDWQHSRHSQTMRAGIVWQFDLFGQAESNTCLDCHAPLAEQKALVARDMGWPNAPAGDLPEYVPAHLHHQGLTCAACHVRRHERFGPEHRAGLAGTEAGLPHGGFHPRAAFSDSRFCASCHQFPEDGPRLNGKLRQDTYNEWSRSRFGRQGVSCQDCHMPDRRHLWRGITDPDMVRRAMAVDLQGARGADGTLDLELTLTNVGAGHHFPAYMVPRIDVRVTLVDPDGLEVESLLHHVIQWRTSVDLTEEKFDTRLPAGESVHLAASHKVPLDPGYSLALHIDVAPKDHYERMYRDMMRQAARMKPRTVELLQIAMHEAAATRYRAVEERIALDGDVTLSLRYRPLPDPEPAP